MTGLFSRAATVVRDAKEAATPGPWTIVKRFNRKHPAVVAGAELVTPERTKGITLKHSWTLHNETWNALTNPDIGGPLADLLDLAERFVAAYPGLVREHVDGEPCDDFACGIVTHIRDLARTLLAEEATE